MSVFQFSDSELYQVINANVSWMMTTMIKSFSETANTSNLEAGCIDIKVSLYCLVDDVVT